ncbi:Uncharacterized protein PHSC3_001901 [Chlamydiales bacterium STE3]|nr:Uncharacterized protein PHSC3_001901 [Chlamydiales bacterium STE3]
MRKIFILLTLIYSLVLHAEITTREIEEACEEMDWFFEGRQKLPFSHSLITVPDGHVLLVGKQAQQFRSLMDAMEVDDAVEGILFAQNEPYDSVIIKSYHEEGYISCKDWKEIDANALMATICSDTEECNKQRRLRENEEQIEIVRWLKEPTRDDKTYTIHWAIEAKQGNEQIVNSVALKLSRYGYELFVWVTSKEHYTSSGGELEIALKAHHFSPGNRYEDYTYGDKIATYGIAGLVIKITGAKVATFHSLSWTLVSVKIIFSVIFALSLWGLYSLCNFFRKREELRI